MIIPWVMGGGSTFSSGNYKKQHKICSRYYNLFIFLPNIWPSLKVKYAIQPILLVSVYYNSKKNLSQMCLLWFRACSDRPTLSG